MGSNGDLPSALNALKSGHSLSFDRHDTTIPDKVGPRSALLSKAKSIPKLPCDTSYEAVQESINRKLLHQHIYSQNNAVFRRTAKEESCSKYVSLKHSMRDLLPTMHPVSDPNDICPPKFGYNFTRLAREAPDLRTSVEDFIQPKRQDLPRRTGYSRGHIRSVMELDTFGPSHSEKVNDARSQGSLPLSPNLDRNRPTSRAGTDSPFGSRVGSRAGSRGGSRGGSKALATGRSDASGLNKSPSFPGLVGGTWDQSVFSEMDRTQPLVRPTTEGFLGDSRGSSIRWAKERQAKLQEKREARERLKKHRADLERQRMEADEHENYVYQFEQNLKSIKSYL